MVCNFPELSLDLSPPLSDYPIIDVADSADLIKLNQLIHGLEDEIKKIQAFQRELPLSFTLLKDAIQKFKEKVKKCEQRRAQQQEGKFGETVGVKLGIDVVDKKDWMSSVQLWAPSTEKEEKERKSEVGAISSFKVDEKAPGLSLVTVVTPPVVEPSCRLFPTGGVLAGLGDQTGKLQSKPGYQSGSRKQRRCWSPELHRRFVDALEKLGGSQVATPKQIRELMQVDGLTNDEVKSHLQKYRLHIRKQPGGSTKTLSSLKDEGMGGETLELGYSNSDIQQSCSPESPLHYPGSKKYNSCSMDEDEEENSDGRSWKGQQRMQAIEYTAEC